MAGALQTCVILASVKSNVARLTRAWAKGAPTVLITYETASSGLYISAYRCC